MTLNLPAPVPHHLTRAPLPWHGPEHARTECGRPVTPGTLLTTVPEIRAQVARIGRERSLYNVCRTCLDTATRWGATRELPATWETDPRAVMLRWIEARSEGDAERMTGYLRAIGALVLAHREEFDGYLDGLTTTVDLNAARAARSRADRLRGRR